MLLLFKSDIGVQTTNAAGWILQHLHGMFRHPSYNFLTVFDLSSGLSTNLLPISATILLLISGQLTHSIRFDCLNFLFCDKGTHNSHDYDAGGIKLGFDTFDSG